MMAKGDPTARRLAIVEIMSVDPRRKLVLVQRDDKEHLILLSATGETVVETGIDAPDPASLARPETIAGDDQ